METTSIKSPKITSFPFCVPSLSRKMDAMMGMINKMKIPFNIPAQQPTPINWNPPIGGILDPNHAGGYFFDGQLSTSPFISNKMLPPILPDPINLETAKPPPLSPAIENNDGSYDLIVDPASALLKQSSMLAFIFN
jgi:hypothetical protein